MSEQQAMNEAPDPEVQQQTLPLATATLVLAIVSVVGCVFYGIPGVLLSIIAIVLHGRAKRMYLTDPAVFQQSYNNARAGWIIAIISLGISIATTVYTVYVFYVLWYAIPVK